MKICNLGCIGPAGLVVELDDIVCLVGANNCGKSTVLRAYEAAVNLEALGPTSINSKANGQSATVELWIHIPEGVENIDSKWKEEVNGLLLVRSKWEWSSFGGKPTRSTWDPSISDYAEDGKAAGLDNVFKSRLPKPFRIGSLQDPEEEHKKLLGLVLDPIRLHLESLVEDSDSPLGKKLKDLREEAEKPLESFKEDLESVRKKVNKSYQRVFGGAEVRLSVSLGELGIDPGSALSKSSYVEVLEGDGVSKWNQQGTGSQRTLFWSMLEVRSELNRIEEEKKSLNKAIGEKEKELKKIAAQIAKSAKPETKQKYEDEFSGIQAELAELKGTAKKGGDKSESTFLPGYMLLIDEPETALHPGAIRAAKEHLYSLAAESGWQVMLSTHNPVFVDPLKDHTTIVRLHRSESFSTPNIYRADALEFEDDEKANLKSLLAFDSTVSEMFFGPRVVIVEGDTEFAAFTEVMNSHPEAFPLDGRPLILRARGKATIPILVKMLTHFKVNFAVLHDIDPPRISTGAKANGAYTVNESIKKAIGSARAIGLHAIHRCSCPNFELAHGMSLPDKDKPFETWKSVKENEAVRKSVRSILDELCIVPSPDSADHPDDGGNYEVKLREWVKLKAIDVAAYVFPDE